MKRRKKVSLVATGFIVALGFLACSKPDVAPVDEALDPALVASGKTIFRYETFGDETFWTDTLRLHEVIDHVRSILRETSPTLSGLQAVKLEKTGNL